MKPINEFLRDNADVQVKFQGVKLLHEQTFEEESLHIDSYSRDIATKQVTL